MRRHTQRDVGYPYTNAICIVRHSVRRVRIQAVFPFVIYVPYQKCNVPSE